VTTRYPRTAKSCPSHLLVAAPEAMKKFKHHVYFAKPRQEQRHLFPHVCFSCRKSFKKPTREIARLCPQCHGPMVMLSRKFSAPRMTDVEQWRKVEFLVSHGFRFQSIHEQPGGSLVDYPATLAEAKLFVRATCRPSLIAAESGHPSSAQSNRKTHLGCEAIECRAKRPFDDRHEKLSSPA